MERMSSFSNPLEIQTLFKTKAMEGNFLRMIGLGEIEVFCDRA
jgi:hypothetical protein